MFEVPIHNKTYVGYVDPETPLAWKEDNVKILINKILEINNPVVIHVDNLPNLVFCPNGWTLDSVKQDFFIGWNKFKGGI